MSELMQPPFEVDFSMNEAQLEFLGTSDLNEGVSFLPVDEGTIIASGTKCGPKCGTPPK